MTAFTDRGSNATLIAESELEADILQLVLQLVENACILHPNESAADLASNLFYGNYPSMAESQALARFTGTLITRYLVRAINAERRKSRPKPVQIVLFEGLDLPQRITTPEGKRPLLAKATATEIRGHVKGLNRKHRNRIAGLQKLLSIMGKYTGKNRRLSAAMVADIESRRPNSDSGIKRGGAR